MVQALGPQSWHHTSPWAPPKPSLLVMPGLCLDSLACTPAYVAGHAFPCRVKPPDSQWPLGYLHIVRQAGAGNHSRGTFFRGPGCFPWERGCQEDRHSPVCLRSSPCLQCLTPSILPPHQPRLEPSTLLPLPSTHFVEGSTVVMLGEKVLLHWLLERQGKRR